MSGERPRVVRSTEAPKDGDVQNVPGNHFDKHGSSNPVVRWLMARFHGGLVEAIGSVPNATLLDAGCGEGRTTAELAVSFPQSTIVGAELEMVAVSEAPANAPGVAFLSASVYDLPFPDSSFDTVVATEVLEHLDDPSSALDEMTRVARHALVLTVPHEPWWRVANVARGRYLGELGNTPGHVQHWTTASFGRFVGGAGARVDARPVGLWTLAVLHL